jgi:tRNA (cmo5U34)-methyltransferase
MTWKFDAKVAANFVEHARQHIPNYDLVINKSVEVCNHYLSSDDVIVDVGCATGETIRRLSLAGFKNLIGVDYSQDMLDQCPKNLAKYFCDPTFPKCSVDAVLCNWTLHFVKDKISYLKDIFQNLNPGGFLILSEKTSLDPVSVKFYHEIKRKNGVSDQAILDKEASVANIMYIHNPLWYLETLDQIGFQNIQIIDASWCFTTFLCYKN